MQIPDQIALLKRGTAGIIPENGLEEKLAKILEEFGVDKLADVLDSEEGGPDFDQLYVEAMRQPDTAVERAEALAAELRKRALASREGTKVLGPSEAISPDAAQRLAHFADALIAAVATVERAILVTGDKRIARVFPVAVLEY